MKTKSFLIIANLLLLLAGCSKTIEPSRIAIISNDAGARNAETKLAEAASSISQSLQQLAAIEKATHPQVKMQSPVAPEMIGMSELVSIEWSGPVGQLVEKIAKVSKYRLKTIGTAPAIPILVSISAKNTPLSDILRDTTFQCMSKANVVVYPASKIIELRYAKA